MENLKRIVNEYFPEYDTWLDTHVTKNPVWVAEVGKGDYVREIIDDDGRPGFPEKSWLRLKQLIEITDLSINKFYLRWRRKRICVLEDFSYIFFARCLQADWPSGQNLSFFLTGTGNDTIIVQRWALPTLEWTSPVERRSFEETKPEFIIWNNTYTNPAIPTNQFGQMDT